MSTRLLLVRHGETEWHADNRYAGSSDVALTARGHAQAEALGTFADALPERPAALYCSPQSRALATAGAPAKALGLEPTVLEDLREVHFGIAEGRTLSEVRATDPEAVERFLRDPVAGSFPQAEPPERAAERGVAALRAIAGGEPGPVLVVAHNTLLRLTLCALLGIPLAKYRAVFPRLENCAITELAFPDDGQPSLLRLNLPAR